MNVLPRRSWLALGLGAMSVGFASLAPSPIGQLGLVGYLVAIAIEPWTAVPLIVLALPFSAQPRLLGSVELTIAEVVTIIGAVVVGGNGLLRGGDTGNLAWTRPPPTPLPEGEGTDALPATPSLPPREAINGEEGADALPAGAMAVAGFLVAGLLSLLVTEYPKQSLRELRWVIVEPICLFLIARATLTNAERIAVTLWALVAAGALAALTALVSAATSGELLTLATRPAYPYQSPNHLGLFLGRSAAVAFALTCFGPGRRWAAGALVPIGLALVRTLSLGAWAGVGGAALAVAALRGRRWVVGIALALLVGVAVIAMALPRERTFGRFDATSGTGLFRLQIWESSIHMIRDHPVLGVGLDNFLYQYRGHYILPEAWEEPNISHPHNWILHFWLALGLPGLLAAVGALIWMANRARALVMNPLTTVDRTVGAAAVGILIDTLLHGSFDNSYFLFDAAMVWWLLAALLTVAGPGGSASKVSPARSRTMGAELPL